VLTLHFRQSRKAPFSQLPRVEHLGRSSPEQSFASRGFVVVIVCLVVDDVQLFLVCTSAPVTGTVNQREKRRSPSSTSSAGSARARTAAAAEKEEEEALACTPTHDVCPQP
jgi:hypothetical protein